MRIDLCFAGALSALALLAAAPALARAPDPDAAVDSLIQAFDNGADHAEVERLARAVTANAGADTLTATRLFIARIMLGDALLGQRRCAEAGVVADEATRADPGRVETWLLAFSAALHCEQFPTAARALAQIVRIDPTKLSNFRDFAIIRAANWSSDAELLTYLVSGGWRPAERTSDLAGLRLNLIEALIARRDLQQAQEIAHGLVSNSTTNLSAVILLLSDRRYERIIASDPETFDFNAILEWQLNNARAMAAAEPDRSMTQQTLANILFDHGRHEEALAVISDALARPGDFTDFGEGESWLLNTRADILQSQGDSTAAMETLRAGAETLEDGRPNISQRLNYASMLVHYDRPAEALAQLEDFDTTHASGYGRMVMLRVLVCANAQLGNAVEMRRYLAEAVAMRDSSLRQVYSMALCANDQTLAARTLLQRLDHKIERSGVIVSSHDYLDDPAPPTQSEALIEARDAAVRARPEVARALRRAVNVRSFPIRRP